jgi:hypothetical protein
LIFALANYSKIIKVFAHNILSDDYPEVLTLESDTLIKDFDVVTHNQVALIFVVDEKNLLTIKAINLLTYKLVTIMDAS